MKRRAGHNSAVARGTSQERPSPASWDALDRLPPAMRLTIWQAPVSINPLSALELIQMSGGIEEAVAEIHFLSECEIAAFSRDHQTRHGYPLPHVAAHVDPQPYEPPTTRPSRARRRR